MDNRNSGNMSSEKAAQPDEPELRQEENVAIRAVAFPDNNDGEKHIGGARPKGVEMKREMTQEDRELAAAGYDHLEEQKAKKGVQTSKLDDVDLQEHRLTFRELSEALDTSIDVKDAGQSTGLTPEEAKVRLARDGRNELTPPKKKSALRKVVSGSQSVMCYSLMLRTVFRLPPDDVQHPPNRRRRPRVCVTGN